MNTLKRKYRYIIILTIILLVVGAFTLTQKNIEVKYDPETKRYDLIVRWIPFSSTSLDYEIVYKNKKGITSGIMGKGSIKPYQFTYKKASIVLGVCSTGGYCNYDELAGPMNVTIKFRGSYGEKIRTADINL